MFSSNTRQEFLAYLRDIQEHADPAIVEYVHHVVVKNGVGSPYTLYEYDRNRRERGKEPREQEG